MNGKTILYVIIDDPKDGTTGNPKMVEVGEVVSGSTFLPEDSEPTEDLPTPTATYTLSMNVKINIVSHEQRDLRHEHKEEMMLGWRPEPTRPPARPRRPHGRPRWFRTRSFCVRRGWH